MRALAIGILLALLVGLTVAACHDPNAPASPTPIELDIDHYDKKPKYKAPKAPSYRKPSARRR